MKVYPNRFNESLKRGLQAVYVITGDEQLQVNECCDALRDAARKQGYTERKVYSVDIDSGYEEFLQSSDNLSLFAELKVIEIRLPRGKTGKEWGQALNRYLEKPPEGTLLLVSGNKLERGVSNSAWHKKADKLGVVVNTWRKNPGELLTWVADRLRGYRLRASRTAMTLIVQRVEGNMLAAEQEIQKLALLFPDSEIGEAEVIASVADSSRYTVFDLTHAALEGNPSRVVRILQSLQSEGVAQALVHWSVAQEIKTMSSIAQAQLAGTAPDKAIANARLPRNKVALARKALQRHTERSWLSMLAHAARIDRMIKGRESGDCWNELLELTLFVAGRKLALAGH